MKALQIRTTCPDCGVKIGQPHEPGCDLEVCPFCGQQMLSDDCCYTYFGIDIETMEEKHPNIYQNGLPGEMDEKYEEYLQPHLLPWDGVWPGVRECREYNLWCKMTADGWQKCSTDDPEAREDLNELSARSTWDKEKKRYVLRADDFSVPPNA